LDKLEQVKLLPKNTFYLYRRRVNKTEYWRKGIVKFAYSFLPIHVADFSRVAFFNSDMGKKFDTPKRVIACFGKPKTKSKKH